MAGACFGNGFSLRSLDGRYFGLVNEDEIYGKALGVYRRRGEGFVWNPL